MNISGIGIDAVDIRRFEKAVAKHGRDFLKKMFTEKEMEYAGAKKDHIAHMAGKFAAKEAVKKALPDGARIGLNWAEIEVLNDNEGKPYVCLHGSAGEILKEYGLARVLVSISHTAELAVSNAIGVRND
ncbi:MAG: holo-ACP synthase [Candidatus Omnitrophota bacterium]|nr:holo-ACP synthase [Candidatus Omnitrophota bacterium]